MIPPNPSPRTSGIGPPASDLSPPPSGLRYPTSDLGPPISGFRPPSPALSLSKGPPTVPVSVIIPTWRRVEDLRKTLPKLFACRPAPAEVLIHIDHGDDETEPFLREGGFPVKILTSPERRGPGGGRDRLLREAREEIVASFDDDSYPLDGDYFQTLLKCFRDLPEASVLSAQVFYRGEPVREAGPGAARVFSFIGCGCAYRRSHYTGLRGYLPIAVPYGMEETDLVLQLLQAGRSVVQTDRLRVYHDTVLRHHASPRVVAGTMANTALFAWLHYPVRYWPKGLGQVANTVKYALTHGRYRGITGGLVSIPGLLAKHRSSRSPLPVPILKKYWNNRDKRVPVTERDSEPHSTPPIS